VDDEKRLYADLQIVCYEGPHYFWSMGIALPSLVVWGLGIPFFAFVLLARDKERLGTLEMK
jgi:hypothetical protein